jgi:hypothetical protein
MFRELDDAERQIFKNWARRNYSPGEEINPLWHPVVRDECLRMIAETNPRPSDKD